MFSSGSSAHLPDRRSAGIQTEGTVTVVTVDNPPNTHGLTNHLTGSLTSASLSSSTTLTQYRNASTSTREINFPWIVPGVGGATFTAGLCDTTALHDAKRHYAHKRHRCRHHQYHQRNGPVQHSPSHNVFQEQHQVPM